MKMYLCLLCFFVSLPSFSQFTKPPAPGFVSGLPSFPPEPVRQPDCHFAEAHHEGDMDLVDEDEKFEIHPQVGFRISLEGHHFQNGKIIEREFNERRASCYLRGATETSSQDILKYFDIRPGQVLESLRSSWVTRENLSYQYITMWSNEDRGTITLSCLKICNGKEHLITFGDLREVLGSFFKVTR